MQTQTNFVHAQDACTDYTCARGRHAQRGSPHRVLFRIACFVNVFAGETSAVRATPKPQIQHLIKPAARHTTQPVRHSSALGTIDAQTLCAMDAVFAALADACGVNASSWKEPIAKLGSGAVTLGECMEDARCTLLFDGNIDCVALASQVFGDMDFSAEQRERRH